MTSISLPSPPPCQSQTEPAAPFSLRVVHESAYLAPEGEGELTLVGVQPEGRLGIRPYSLRSFRFTRVLDDSDV